MRKLEIAHLIRHAKLVANFLVFLWKN